MAPKVVCTCPGCINHWVVVDEQRIPGKKISAQLRRRHEITAAANKSPDFAKKRPLGVKDFLDEDDDEVDSIGKAQSQDIVIDGTLLIQLCSALVIWLNLKAGLGRDTANTILKALQLILSIALELVQLALTAHGIPLRLPKLQIPQDIRTAYRHHTTDPEIIRTPCCPKCFTLYPSPNQMPERCTAKVSKKSRIACKAELWRTQRFGKEYKRVPKTTFNTQKFESWLEWFLSRKSIEDYLTKAFQRPPAADGEEMCDLQDSPRWKNLKNAGKDKYNLVFGLYIDWFNPRGNRVAGKQASCGTIVLYCLNLPPEVRYLPENVFIVGLTPSPNKPTARALLNLLETFIKKIVSYDIPGKPIATYSHPEGVNVSARIVPLVADLPAARETGGFLGHAATMFCSFCLLTKDERHRSDYWAWPLRTAELVLKQARKWFRLPTKAQRILEQKKTGVRFCPLHFILYRDPVNDTILGFMHNWLEGVLEHQLRVLWGIGRDARRTKSLAELDQDDEDLWTDDDISEAGGEADAQEVLDDEENFDADDFAKWRDNYMRATQSEDEEEEEEEELTPKGTPVPDYDDPMDGSISTATPVPESILADETDEADEADEEFEDVAVRGSWKFSKEQLEKIQHCIKEVSLPTWVSRPPGNLGEKKHGKLKADEFLTLFSVIFPLVIPEIEFDDDPNRHQAMLKSYYDLLGATNILASFKTSNSAADKFNQFYSDYFASLPNLFPDVDLVPNHHYAWHNTSILKNWGPLASQNEFMGERMNGLLQKVPTNDHLYDMDFTMLRQMARFARLSARQHDRNSHEKHAALQTLDNILSPEDPRVEKLKELNEADLAQFLAKKKHEMPVWVYNLILGYLDSVGEHKLSFWGTRGAGGVTTLPDPDHRSMILPPRAKRCRKFYLDKRTFSCYSSHRGNSLIQFYQPGTDRQQDETFTGVIDAIFKIPVDNFLRTFVLARKFCPLNIQPFASHPELMAAVVYAEPDPSRMVIEPNHVITHLTAWKRAPEIYHTNKPVMVVCWALNRGRR